MDTGDGHGICQRKLIHYDDVRFYQLSDHRVIDQWIFKLRQKLRAINQHNRPIRHQAWIERRNIHNPSGIGHAASLNHHVIKRLSAVHHRHERTQKTIGHAATHATVRQCNSFAVMPSHQTFIDIQLTEIIHQNGETGILCFCQKTIQKRRLTSTQKAPEHRERQQRLGLREHHRIRFYRVPADRPCHPSPSPRPTHLLASQQTRQSDPHQVPQSQHTFQAQCCRRGDPGGA